MTQSGVEVNFVINKADYIENDVKDRKNAYKHINNRFIRVTFKEENDNIFIITATKGQIIKLKAGYDII